jgi:hypothetical protein
MLARISFKGFVLCAVLAAGLAVPAAGQVGYFLPPYQTWPPSSPGFYPAPAPQIFWPYQFGSPYGSGSLFLFSPGYLPYGSLLIQPGYPGPYAYGYPYYGLYPYQYLNQYYNWYYSPQGPYLWHWRGRDYGQRRPQEPSGPTEVQPRKGTQRWNQQEPIVNRQPRGRPMASGAGTRVN